MRQPPIAGPASDFPTDPRAARKAIESVSPTVNLPAFFARLLPEAGTLPLAEQLRSALAAAVGACCVALLSAWLLPTPPFMVAAVGASVVLVFALPASPLAQPWSVVGSYLVCALAGVTAAHWVGHPPLAAALAVGLGTLGMLLLRCLHPPGGAVALFAVIGGEKIAALGYGYVLTPVLANALLLVGVALAVNNLMPGRRYPRPLPEVHPHGVADPAPLARLGLSHEDLRTAIAGYGRPLYIGGEELDEIITLAERNAYRRRFGDMVCAEVMSRHVVTVGPDTSLLETWGLLRRHRLCSLLVADAVGRVVGQVSLEDFVRSARVKTPGGLRQRLYLLLRHHMGRDHGAGAIMHRPPLTVHPETHVAELVPAMTRRVHQVPVVDAGGRLQGVVTQSDLIAALYYGRLAEDA